MSKADEMFKELGYEDLSEESAAACICLYGKQDKRIGFYTDMTIDCYEQYDGSGYIEIQELQAINEKVKELRMELVENSLKTINEYCTSNYMGCSECDIEVACEKYFNREPRNWKIPKEWKEDKEVF